MKLGYVRSYKYTSEPYTHRDNFLKTNMKTLLTRKIIPVPPLPEASILMKAPIELFHACALIKPCEPWLNIIEHGSR